MGVPCKEPKVETARFRPPSMEASAWHSFATGQYPWIAVATLLAVALPTLLMYFNQLLFMPWKQLLMGGLPPGQLGLPFIGNLLEASPASDPDIVFTKHSAKYGLIAKFLLLGKPGVIVYDVAAKKHILMNEGILFKSEMPPSIRMSLGASSLLSMTGDAHKATRALLSRWLNLDFLQRFLPRVEAAVVRSMEQCLKKGTVMCYDEARELTFGIICNILISVPPGPIQKELSDLFKVFVEGMFTLVPINHPFTKFGKTMEARAKVVTILSRIYNQRKAEISAMPNPSDLQPRDVLDAFILYGEGDSLGGGKVGGYSEAEVFDTILTMLFAGHETTSSVLTWLLYLIKSDPETLKAVRDEHDAIAKTKGSGEGLNWADYKSMKFTQKVIAETQRFRGPVSFVFRKTLTDVKIGGYTIRKGWLVQIGFTHSAKLTDKYFNEPERFDVKHFDHTPPAFAFTPFGAGVRMCPGMELARLELHVFLHYFVTRCNWEGTEPGAPHRFLPILVPAQGYQMKVEPRVAMP